MVRYVSLYLYEPTNHLNFLEDLDSEDEAGDIQNKLNAINLRATSEPPPDSEEIPHPAARATHSPSRRKRRGSKAPASLAVPGLDADYLWEWGAFPQRSPYVDTFSGSRSKGHRASNAPSLGSLAAPGMVRARSHSPDLDTEARPRDDEMASTARLIGDKSDSMRMGAFTSGHTLWFELSVLNYDLTRMSDGRKGVLLGMEEVEAADLFDQGAVSFEQFLADESVLREKGLVMRLADER
jgi:phosphatidate phosphatase LPIN